MTNLTPAQRGAQTRKRNRAQHDMQHALEVAAAATQEASDMICETSQWTALPNAAKKAISAIDEALTLLQRVEQATAAIGLTPEEVDSLLEARTALRDLTRATIPADLDDLDEATCDTMNAVHLAASTLTALTGQYTHEVNLQGVPAATRELVHNNID